MERISSNKMLSIVVLAFGGLAVVGLLSFLGRTPEQAQDTPLQHIRFHDIKTSSDPLFGMGRSDLWFLGELRIGDGKELSFVYSIDGEFRRATIIEESESPSLLFVEPCVRVDFALSYLRFGTSMPDAREIPWISTLPEESLINALVVKRGPLYKLEDETPLILFERMDKYGKTHRLHLHVGKPYEFAGPVESDSNLVPLVPE